MRAGVFFIASNIACFKSRTSGEDESKARHKLAVLIPSRHLCCVGRSGNLYTQFEQRVNACHACVAVDRNDSMPLAQSRRFATIPSRPSSQAARKRAQPSSRRLVVSSWSPVVQTSVCIGPMRATAVVAAGPAGRRLERSGTPKRRRMNRKNGESVQRPSHSCVLGLCCSLNRRRLFSLQRPCAVLEKTFRRGGPGTHRKYIRQYLCDRRGRRALVRLEIIPAECMRREKSVDANLNTSCRRA